ncbi:MAG: hypothetical protein PHW35_03570 [Lentimicrobiaceae bacterium]|nr:hypothetical protein [Lentimicrobiaceae bacterium]
MLLPHATLVLLFVICPFTILAQQSLDTIVRGDTTRMPADTLSIISDDSTKLNKHNNHLKNIENRKQQTADFFNKLEAKKDSNFVWKNLYPLLFKNNKTTIEDVEEGKEVGSEVKQFEGRPVRKIVIHKLGVFGTSVYDTSYTLTNLERFLNSTHINTMTSAIKKYLLIKPGDALEPLILADNERLIRSVPIFNDARFIVNPLPDNDSIDLVLIIKDVYPLGFEFKATGLNRSSLTLSNSNIFGSGHKIEQKIDYDNKEKQAIYLSEGAYKIRNIMGSFIDAEFTWKSAPDGKALAIKGNKPFITPETRFGGGLTIGRFTRLVYYDSLPFRPEYKYNHLDIWSGYATIIERDKSFRKLRTQAAIAGRYTHTYYLETPLVPDREITEFKQLQRYLINFNYLKSGFYRNNMIFGFGRTEDIPIGYLAEATLGYEKFDDALRTYTALNFLRGDKIYHSAYLYSRINLGGYWHKGDFTDGFISADLFYISNLLKAGNNRIRHFFQLHYLSGINREHYRLLQLNNNPLTTTYNNFNYRGRQRINLRTEAVLFTSYYILGFRFAPYSFIEMAMISSHNRNIFKNPIYPAIGLGIRVKNENLVFSTFQFSFTIYPRADTPGSNLFFEVDRVRQINLEYFGINPPQIPEFR